MDDFGDEEREDFARQDGVRVGRERRSPPRLPAGTMRLAGNEAGGCIPVVSGAPLTESEIGLFGLIQGEVLNPIRFGIVDLLPVAEDYREALQRIARAAFGCEPADAIWLVPFLGELAAARGERLALESQEAHPGTTDLMPIASAVIERTRRRAQRLAPSIDLPPWLSPRLALLLLKRFSFVGGGGKNAALTAESIQRLLADPRELQTYLGQPPERALRFQEELALLEAAIAAPEKGGTTTKPAQPDVVDKEHATPSERRDARAAANRPSWLAKVPASWIVFCEGGFVGVNF